MEATRAEKARLGVFIVALAALLVVLVLFLVGGKLFTRTDEYFTRMEESVTGLEPGSTVKQNGVDVGEIKTISADSADIRKTVVRFSVKRGTPLKKDMTVSLGSYGITGLKYLEITGGSYGAPNVPKGGEVRSELSMMGRLTSRADSIAHKVDRLLGNIIAITEMDNRENLNRMMAASASLAESLDSMAVDIRNVKPGRRLEAILADVEATSRSLKGQVQRARIDSAVNDYRLAAQDIQKIVRNSQEDVSVSLTNLKEIMKNMNTFTRQIKENPSILLRREEKRERGQ
jgi:phospholipid/cholesterol/gamma-HCH transport system substrate-binding protein